MEGKPDFEDGTSPWSATSACFRFASDPPWPDRRRALLHTIRVMPRQRRGFED